MNIPLVTEAVVLLDGFETLAEFSHYINSGGLVEIKSFMPVGYDKNIGLLIRKK